MEFRGPHIFIILRTTSMTHMFLARRLREATWESVNQMRLVNTLCALPKAGEV